MPSDQTCLALFDIRQSRPRSSGLTIRREFDRAIGQEMSLERSSATTAKARVPYVGQRVLRVENPPLLKGRGQFIDDLPVKTGTLHAAFLRSPHAHAEIVSIDTSAARARPSVRAAVTW